MESSQQILAIDQGTTSSRAIVFDENYQAKSVAQKEFKQIYPNDGWVEHDPEEIWQTILETSKQAIKESGGKIEAIGITNQRETTILWDKNTGKAIYNAIVWQDRRTADKCHLLKEDGIEEVISAKTGLLLDPYFSATKIAWILENVEGAKEKAAKGELAFGTVDSFLLWKLTEGRVHATDATNASRTMLYNIHENCWDEDLLDVFEIPANILPEVRDSASNFGSTKLFGDEIAITGIAGDQQAATIGQACFRPGMVKSTYGTGCFVMANTGEKPMLSNNKLLTTILYQIDGKVVYGLEGSIFIAGAAVQWLRDSLQIIDNAKESEQLAASLEGNNGVYLVPAFTGLGAPHWNPEARASIFGMTRDTGRADIVRATLESVCYQTYDLLKAMSDDGIHPMEVRVDGGMANNNWLMKFLADILSLEIKRPSITETTVLGAAYLAALGKGMHSSIDDLVDKWQLDQEFSPKMAGKQKEELLNKWNRAVKATIGF